VYELILELLKRNPFTPYTDIAQELTQRLRARYIMIDRTLFDPRSYHLTVDEKAYIIARVLSGEDEPILEALVREANNAQ